MNRGIRWDAEYVVFLMLGTLLGLVAIFGTWVLYLVNMVAQNAAAG